MWILRKNGYVEIIMCKSYQLNASKCLRMRNNTISKLHNKIHLQVLQKIMKLIKENMIFLEWIGSNFSVWRHLSRLQQIY